MCEGARFLRRPAAYDMKQHIDNAEDMTMNPLEKMRAGRWLYAMGPEIGAALQCTKERLFEFNALPPGRKAEREAILRELFGALGRNPYVHSPFHCDFGTQIEAGDDVVINFGVTILDEAPVRIGDRTLIGPQVGIYTVNHALLPDQRAEGIMRAQPVEIGRDVWIGGHSVILPGVRIGDGAVIGAGSVVTRDVPPGVIAAGNPCRVLRPITEADRVGVE